MNHIALKGVDGEIRWSYHRAATLGTWTLDAGRLTAKVTTSNAFQLSQQPLTFTVRRSNGAVWSWPICEIHIDGSSLSAVLVPEENG